MDDGSTIKINRVVSTCLPKRCTSTALY